MGETARISDFLPRHISPTKIRHFGEALFGGEFCTGPIFHIGRYMEEKKLAWCLGELTDWGVGGKYYLGDWGVGEGINSGSTDQSQGCIM